MLLCGDQDGGLEICHLCPSHCKSWSNLKSLYTSTLFFTDNKYFKNKINVACYDFRNFTWFEHMLLYILYIEGLKQVLITF